MRECGSRDNCTLFVMTEAYGGAFSISYGLMHECKLWSESCSTFKILIALRLVLHSICRPRSKSPLPSSSLPLPAFSQGCSAFCRERHICQDFY